MQRKKRIMRRKDNRLGYGNQYLDVFKSVMVLHLRGQPEIFLEPQIAVELSKILEKAVDVQRQVNNEAKIDKHYREWDIHHTVYPEDEMQPTILGVPTISDIKNQES